MAVCDICGGFCNPCCADKKNIAIETDRRELAIIQFETQRNDAMEKYFAARPQLFRTREKECLFEAGFRMAWEQLKKDNT
jgi:hypothetical protein